MCGSTETRPHSYPAACALLFFILRVCACKWKQKYIYTWLRLVTLINQLFIKLTATPHVCMHLFPFKLAENQIRGDTYFITFCLRLGEDHILIYFKKKMTSPKLKALLLGVSCGWNSLKGSDSKSEWVMIWTRWSLHLNDWRQEWEWTKWEEMLPGCLEFLNSWAARVAIQLYFLCFQALVEPFSFNGLINLLFCGFYCHTLLILHLLPTKSHSGIETWNRRLRQTVLFFPVSDLLFKFWSTYSNYKRIWTIHLFRMRSQPKQKTVLTT